MRWLYGSTLVDARDAEGFTAAHRVAATVQDDHVDHSGHGCVETMHLLVDAGADVTLTTPVRLSPHARLPPVGRAPLMLYFAVIQGGRTTYDLAEDPALRQYILMVLRETDDSEL